MKFGVGASQLKHLSPEESVRFASQTGFQFLQWNPVVTGERGWGKKWESNFDIERIKKLGREAKKSGVPLLAMHLPYLPTPELNLDFIRASIKAAKAAGASYLITHPVAYGNYIDFFTKAEALCRSVKLELLVENPSRKEYNIGIAIPTVYSPLHFLRLIKQSGVNVCYDCNHAVRVGLDPLDFYAMVSKFTRVIHISDARSDLSVQHGPIGAGEIDFKNLFKLIKSSKFKGLVVLELSNSHHNLLESQLKTLKRELSK